MTLTLDQFTYGFANAVSAAEAAALYEEFHVSAPGRPVFQVGLANQSLRRTTKVRTRASDRGPLLVIGGTSDHTIPFSLAKAAWKKQSRNAAVTTLVEIEGAGHSLVIDRRWDEVADAALAFLEEHEI